MFAARQRQPKVDKRFFKPDFGLGNRLLFQQLGLLCSSWIHLERKQQEH